MYSVCVSTIDCSKELHCIKNAKICQTNSTIMELSKLECRFTCVFYIESHTYVQPSRDDQMIIVYFC